MSVRYRVVTPPEVLPVATADLRTHCRVFVDGEDAYLEALCKAASELTQAVTCRSWITQTIEARFESFPTNGKPLTLFYPPLQSVTVVHYGPNATLWDPSEYEVVAGTPGEIRPIEGKAWPSAGPVFVEFVAGYGDGPEDVPQAAKLAMSMLVSQFYEQRAAVSAVNLTKVPFAVEALLSVLRWGQYP